MTTTTYAERRDEVNAGLAEQAPAEVLEVVRRDLANMDDELLELLFPRHPVEKKPARKSSGGPGVSP